MPGTQYVLNKCLLNKWILWMLPCFQLILVFSAVMLNSVTQWIQYTAGANEC